MKKILNSAATLVDEMCQGIVLAHSSLGLLSQSRVIYKKSHDQDNKVSLISGGGSGHEPAHAGFVGNGMLDAAVCGDVFASPSQIQVYQAIRAVAGKKGTLLIIKNYSGDVMNFLNALRMAQEEGYEVDYVKVNDDIAVQDSLYTIGRRGVAGTVFVHKIAGAAAAKGLTLPEVKHVAQHAADNVRSIGFALSSCTVPAKGSPIFTLEDQQMEYGVGIHGEPGRSREELVSADVLAERMTEALVTDLRVSADQDVALLINGFGATPLQELYVLNTAVRKALSSRNIPVHRTFVGNYMTSLDMAGGSVSILKLDEALKCYLDAPCDAPAFCVNGPVCATSYVDLSDKSYQSAAQTTLPQDASQVRGDKLTLKNIQFLVQAMTECIIKNEVSFCTLDSYAGDGDFGMSIAKGFRRLKQEWSHILDKESETIGTFLNACSLVIMEHCGGASGPIWGSAFRAAGFFAGSKTKLSMQEFSRLMQAALLGVQKTGERSFGRGAVVGDKTLVDALDPCVQALLQCAQEGASLQDALAKGAQAAVEGAEKTKQIVARMGRAGTVGERSIGYPDAGAYALGVIFTEIAEALSF